MERSRLAEVVLPVRATARKTSTWEREKGTFTSGATMTEPGKLPVGRVQGPCWLLPPLLLEPACTTRLVTLMQLLRTARLNTMMQLLCRDRRNFCAPQLMLSDCKFVH